MGFLGKKGGLGERRCRRLVVIDGEKRVASAKRGGSLRGRGSWNHGCIRLRFKEIVSKKRGKRR